MERTAVLNGSAFTVQATRTGLMSAASIFLFLCAWHLRVAGQLSLASCGVLAVLVALYLVYGHLFVTCSARLFHNTVGLPFQFLCGYFVSNTLLFILALASPFGIGINIALLALLAAIGVFAVRGRARQLAASDDAGDSLAAWVAVIVAGVGATIWCGDIQGPLQVQDGRTIFKVWPDVYIHAREISVFAQAHGLASIHDIKLAGGAAPLYHFASYLSAAVVNALGGADAMQVYAGFQLPFGILLTGLAAYSVVGSLFSRWAGVAAAAAVVLLPDGFLQGFANRYLSYYFLSQVNLGMLYGIACAALAWLFVLDGCRQAKLQTVILGYVFLGICLVYKAHIFVANSYLLMMFPILFFPPLRRNWRVILGIVATLFFVAVIAYSQTNPRVPVLRLDGSGIGKYLERLLLDYDPGVLKIFFNRVLLTEKHGKAVELIYALALLLVSTFGWWLLALPLALLAARKRVALPLLWFPVLVVGNYLLMSIGLALDSRGVGTPDELLNRPLVWAYFVVAAWGAGLLVHILVSGRSVHGMSPVQQPNRPLVGALLAVLVLAAGLTALVAPNLQIFPMRAGFSSYQSANSVPVCLVDAARFVRTNGALGDIFQDSAGDPQFVLTALSERQLYVGSIGFGGTNTEQMARRDDILRFMRLPETGQVRQFAAARGIKWFLAYPALVLGWPAELTQAPAFSCGGYRLYRFPDAVQAASNK